MAITQERMKAILDAVKEYEENFSKLEEFAKKIIEGKIELDKAAHVLAYAIQDMRITPESIAAIATEKQIQRSYSRKNEYARRWRQRQKNPLNLDTVLGEVKPKDYDPEEDF